MYIFVYFLFFSNHGKLLKLLFLSGIRTIPGVLTIPRLHPYYVTEDISQRILKALLPIYLSPILLITLSLNI
jgi:hypothetical protein